MTLLEPDVARFPIMSAHGRVGITPHRRHSVSWLVLWARGFHPPRRHVLLFPTRFSIDIIGLTKLNSTTTFYKTVYII